MAEAPHPLKTWNDLDGPAGLPIAGNLFQLRLDTFHRTLEQWADRYGRLYRMRIGPGRVAVVSEPEAIKRMHRERPGLFRRTRKLEAVAAEMGLNGVFSAEGDDWLRQRKLVVRALNTAHLRSFFPKLAVIAARLQRRWEHAADAREPVDLCRDLMRLTVDAVTLLAFGIDFNTLETPGPVIQKNLDKVFPMLHRRINAAFPHWRYLRLPKDRELDRALAQIRVQVDDILREVRERMRADPSLHASPTNFLEAIIAAGDAQKLGVTDEEIVANVCTLLLAGEDTTANTIAWTVSYFIRYPEHFARARAEVDAVLAPAASVERIEQAGRFPFLDAFFHEAMRLKPVAPAPVSGAARERRDAGLSDSEGHDDHRAEPPYRDAGRALRRRGPFRPGAMAGGRSATRPRRTTRAPSSPSATARASVPAATSPCFRSGPCWRCSAATSTWRSRTRSARWRNGSPSP